MKTLTLILALLLFSICSFAQLNTFSGQKGEYLYQMEKYHKMKNTGIGLTIVGGALTIAGIITVANSSIDEIDNGSGSTTTEIHGHPIGGLLMIIGGHGALGAGIPLWIAGNAKEKKYQKKFEQVSFNIAPYQRGLTFTIRF